MGDAIHLITLEHCYETANGDIAISCTMCHNEIDMEFLKYHLALNAKQLNDMICVLRVGRDLFFPQLEKPSGKTVTKLKSMGKLSPAIQCQ